MTADTDDILAAEMVLGLLDPAAAEALELRATADRALAATIAGWRERFGEIDRTAPAVAPSSDLWPRIAAAIERPEPVISAVRPAPGLIERLWGHLGLWRGLGIAASVAALIAIVLPSQAPRPMFVAVLQAPDGTQAGAIVNAAADGSIELIPLVDMAVPPGRTLQVWTLWDRARGPVPLGLMPRAQRAHFEATGLPPPQAEQLYEITLEPAAGSPTGRPTGPVLYKGLASKPL